VASCFNEWVLLVRKRSTEILAQLCASAPKRAVVDALLEIKPLSKVDLERLVDELKTTPQIPRPTTRSRPKGDGSPAGRIKRVLTVDAGLPPDQAIAQLRTELLKTSRTSLPAGEALESWLKAVLAVVPAGEVLNAAMTIAARAKS
jgi:hypothetical protein